MPKLEALKGIPKLEIASLEIGGIEVESYVNAHSHLRIHSLAPIFAQYAKDGGADTILFKPNVEGLDQPQIVAKYRDNLRELVPDVNFIASMRMTKLTTVEDLEKAADLGIFDIKVYPEDRTTGSADGLRYYHSRIKEFKICDQLGIRIHLHPANPWKVFGDRDAEWQFLSIAEMIQSETDAPIFWEHGSDARCIPGWKYLARSGKFFVTLTAHHLATYEDLVFGDVRATCQNPIRTREDMEALVRLVGENHKWVLAGLDDAPHPRDKKHPESGRCSCGAYTAPFGLRLYAHALDSILQNPGGVETFVNFTSRNARKVFNLPEASRKIKLVRKPSTRIPLMYFAGPWEVEPFWADEEIGWSFA